MQTGRLSTTLLEWHRRYSPDATHLCTLFAGIPSEQVLGKLWLANLPPIKQAARLFWTPAREGAATVLHAAIDEWGRPGYGAADGSGDADSGLRWVDIDSAPQ